jgi:hypothetical protein
MKRRRQLATALACGVLLVACAQAREVEPRAEPSAVPQQTQASRFLMEVQSTHRFAQADAAGVELLRVLADRTDPHGLTPEDFAAVRRDLYLHAAALAIQLHALDDASAILQAGLAVEGHDPFRVQLHLRAGEVARMQDDKAASARAFEAASAELEALQ